MLEAAIAEWGDMVGRQYLEVKSDVDLSSKEGQAKLAKFILMRRTVDPTLHLEHSTGIAAGAASGCLEGSSRSSLR